MGGGCQKVFPEGQGCDSVLVPSRQHILKCGTFMSWGPNFEGGLLSLPMGIPTGGGRASCDDHLGVPLTPSGPLCTGCTRVNVPL